MVVTAEMRGVAAMGRRDVTYTIGPFITLIAGPAFPGLWEERRRLLQGQLTGADLVAISKSDLLDVGRIEEINRTLNGHCCDLIRLSAHSGAGLEEVLKTLVAS